MIGLSEVILIPSPEVRKLDTRLNDNRHRSHHRINRVARKSYDNVARSNRPRLHLAIVRKASDSMPANIAKAAREKDGDTQRFTTPNANIPFYIWHPSFELRNAEDNYGPHLPLPVPNPGDRYLSASQVIELCKRMHYAAERMVESTLPIGSKRWERVYCEMRNPIVENYVGLVISVVRTMRRGKVAYYDLVNESIAHLPSLIQSFNPWVSSGMIGFLSQSTTRFALGHMKLKKNLAMKQASALRLSSIKAKPAIASDHAETLAKLFSKDDDTLLETEKVILERSYGLNGAEESSANDIAISLGITAGSVKSYKNLAIEKLRKEFPDEMEHLASESIVRKRRAFFKAKSTEPGTVDEDRGGETPELPDTTIT